MSPPPIRFSNVAPGCPFHAAYVPIRTDGFTMHRHHDYSEMFYIRNGSGLHCLPSGAAELSEGDLVFVWQHHEHGFSVDSDQLELVNVAFRTDLVNAFLRIAELDILQDDRAAIPLHVHLAGHDRDNAAGAFDQVLSLFDRSPTALDLVRFWCDTLPLLIPTDSTVRGHPPEWLAHACLAMETEENIGAGLPRMLELASVSHGYLARTMRRYFGVTPIEFIADVRVGHAVRLLRQTDLPIAEISARCGFASPSYFSRQFKRSQGMSPRSFREHARAAVIPR